MRYEVNIPDGQHLGNSRQDPGAHTGLLFDKNGNLVGQATLRPVEEPEPVEMPCGDPFAGVPNSRTQDQRDADAERAAQLAELLVVLAIKGAITAAPHVNRYWGTTLLPWFKALRQRLSSFRLPQFTVGATSAKRAQDLEAASKVVGSQLAVVEAEPKLTMTKAEWDTRVAAMLTAEAFRNSQFDVLRRATVVDPKVIGVGKDPDTKLTPREYSDHMERALGTIPAALEGGLYAALVNAVHQDEQMEREKQSGRAEQEQ
ncbi:hypothetical protein [Isoptericola sp. NPDC019482]|uniref:hypothetical protein n=1 Tax=Isoptericola sp. NPDC019482 TaxID=3154688 RepID=UPI003476DF9A